MKLLTISMAAMLLSIFISCNGKSKNADTITAIELNAAKPEDKVFEKEKEQAFFRTQTTLHLKQTGALK